jgi:isoquinoline 1-oxidoreductase subunit alpha
MVTFRINGASRTLDVEGDVPLLWVLRDELGLTGTKYGCGVAQCGACTVHIDGRAARACVTPAAGLAGRDVVTIEGAAGPVAQAVQGAWRRLDVAQCGYCQPGQIMAAVSKVNELRKKGREITDDDLDEIRNVCRCGTYFRIREAIMSGAKMM